MAHPVFHRLERLVGSSALERLQASRVIVFGVGGVGSWCAEALARSGVGELTLVDSDVVCITNVNRQLQAAVGCVGKPKVEVLQARLLSLHPKVRVEAIQEAYAAETRERFELERYDYVIDAIDSYTNKLDLIEHAGAARVRLYSSMGAACRLDPTQVRTASLWKAKMCPLARIVRKGLRRRGYAGDFTVVYSEEPALEPVDDVAPACGSGHCFCPKPKEGDAERPDWCARKLVVNGSSVAVTAAFGMTLASLVVRDAYAAARGGELTESVSP